MDNILQTLTIPQLGDPNFQAQFEEFCTAVANNFTRMVSIQYAKGEPGSSVYDAVLNVGYDNGGITPLGSTILNAIFGTNIQSGDTQNVVKTSIETVAPSIGTQMVFDEFMSDEPTGITININIDDEQHIAYIAQPYIFIDERIKNLRYLQDEYRENWHDFSIGIYGRGVYDEDLNQDVNDPNTWTWVLQVVAIVPKIYYDRNIHEFCWMVNEQQTGITAQGIKGDTGSGPAMIIAKGHRDNTKLWIDYIQCIDEQGDEKWAALDDGAWKYDDVEVVGPKADDLAIVFWDRNNPNDYQNAFVGKVYINTNQPYVYIPADNITPRLDIFASIKGQNLKELMQTINNGNQGFPRGLMIPADPVQLPHGSQTNPSKYHLIYSEIDNHDSQGRGILHMTPANPGDCEQSDQNPSDVNNPGEMILDYNVQMRNLRVDTITIGDRQESQWNCKIKDPKLACMSRFKKFSYSLERDLTNENDPNYNNSFKYTLKMSGILELNIGMLSVFNEYVGTNIPVTKIWQFAHEAFESYGANWDSGDSPAFGGYSQNDKKYTDNFQESGSRDKSKLYNVVNYEIPFELEKEVSWVNDEQISQDRDHHTNIFNYKEFMFGSGTQIQSIQKSIFFDSLTLNNIQLKFGLIGWNCKRFDASTQTTLISGASFTDENKTPIAFDINNDTDKLHVCTPAGTGHVTSWPTNNSTRSIINNSNIGEVSRLIDILKNNSSQGNEFALTGGIYYDPLEYTLTYKFDIFARIFDLIDIDWVNGNKNCPQYADEFNPEPKSWPTNMNHKVLLKLVPIGYIGTSDQIYNTPIWNAINVKNESIDNNSLNSYDTLLNGLVENKYEYGVELCPPFSDWELEDTFQPTSVSPTYFSHKPDDDTTHYDLIDDPDLTGIIMHGENISSDYIISVFTDENKQTLPIGHLETTYYDVMNNVRVVTDNLKVCPNNVSDGNWKYNSQQASYGWRSLKEVPYVIMPCNGYIGSTHIGAGTGEIPKDKVKLGCANLKYNSDYSPMTLHGVLMYPYTSGIIRGKRPNNSLEVKCLKDTYEDATPILPNVEVGHYPGGKMMGFTNGLISGMIASNNAPTPPEPPTPEVRQPSIVSSGGSPFEVSTTITIQDNSIPGTATIYYTIDGSIPTTSSNVYNGPFQVTDTTTIKAMAERGGEESSIEELTVILAQTIPVYWVMYQRDRYGHTNNSDNEYSQFNDPDVDNLHQNGDGSLEQFRITTSTTRTEQQIKDDLASLGYTSNDIIESGVTHIDNSQQYIYAREIYLNNGQSEYNNWPYELVVASTPDDTSLGEFGQVAHSSGANVYKYGTKIVIGKDSTMVFPCQRANPSPHPGDIFRKKVFWMIGQDVDNGSYHAVDPVDAKFRILSSPNRTDFEWFQYPGSTVWIPRKRPAQGVTNGWVGSTWWDVVMIDEQAEYLYGEIVYKIVQNDPDDPSYDEYYLCAYDGNIGDIDIQISSSQNEIQNHQGNQYPGTADPMVYYGKTIKMMVNQKDSRRCDIEYDANHNFDETDGVTW